MRRHNRPGDEVVLASHRAISEPGFHCHCLQVEVSVDRYGASRRDRGVGRRRVVSVRRVVDRRPRRSRGQSDRLGGCVPAFRGIEGDGLRRVGDVDGVGGRRGGALCPAAQEGLCLESHRPVDHKGFRKEGRAPNGVGSVEGVADESARGGRGETHELRLVVRIRRRVRGGCGHRPLADGEGADFRIARRPVGAVESLYRQGGGVIHRDRVAADDCRRGLAGLRAVQSRV